MSQDPLIDLAERRWARVLGERPDFEPAVALQRRLIGRVIAIHRTLESDLEAALTPPAGYVAAKLARGVPALRGETIPLPHEKLAPELLAFCDTLAEAGAGNAARHLAEVLRAGRLDGASLLAASLARNEPAVRMAAAHQGLAADLVWLIAELAVSPVAHALQRLLFAGPDGRTAAWDRGYCPACGSWPALAEKRGPERLLCCSFCGAEWRRDLPGCIYCGAADGAFRTLAPDSRSRVRRLEECDHCRGYLKLIAPPEPTPWPLTAIEDLGTADLDTFAIGRGLVRPPLPDLPVARPPCLAIGLPGAAHDVGQR